MKQSNGTSRHKVPRRLVSILEAEFAEVPRTCALFRRFLHQKTYRRHFTAHLLDVAKGNTGAGWDIRRVAILMLQYEVLKLSQTATAEWDFLLTQLNLKTPGGEHQKVKKAVLKEGFSTVELGDFILELRQELSRFQYVYKLIKGMRTSPEGLRDFIHLSRRDCHLALARYLFTPEEVVDYILDQVRVSEGIKDLFRFLYVDDEVMRHLSFLPDFESTILRRLRGTSLIYWVSDTTSSEVNRLVEYPLKTVVVVIKPPGSCLEIELKRAGRRGNHPLSAVYERNECPVPPSHRLDGGSISSSLQWEAGHTALLANVYRLVHSAEAPISQVVSISSEYGIPVEKHEELLLHYYTDPHIFGEGFREMRKAMKKCVDAFYEERQGGLSDLPGAVGLSLQFISQVAPGQAIVSGTSAFRIDTVARYLSNEGPQVYFTEGLQRTYSKQDARRFADEILAEVLGLYAPPEISYHEHAQYVAAALSVSANRARADHTFFSLLEQIGAFWGTLLAIRGHSWGESFVARNVGLRSTWEEGQWKVKIIFMDHDNLHLIAKHAEIFSPKEILNGMAVDESYILGRPAVGRPLVSEVNYLEAIYQMGERGIHNGQTTLKRAIARAYRKTHDAMLNNPQVQRFFSKSFVARIRDWDTIVARYLHTRCDVAKRAVWKTETNEFLSSKGYAAASIKEYTETVEQQASFCERLAFLYDDSVTCRPH